jgi:molybdate transport system ATP-binding protein
MLQANIQTRLGTFELDVAFSAARGVTALFGPSGAGKSSILAAVAGAVTPDQGRIVLEDQVLFDSATRTNRPMEGRGLGWVFQDARLFPHLDVAQNLAYAARRTRGRPVVAEHDAVVEVLGLSHLLSRRVTGLSGGERQRVALARALLAQPRLLLMDEPLAALDGARRAELLPFLARLTAAFDIPVLYVTHSLWEVVHLADQVLVMDGGGITDRGPLDQVALSAPQLLGRRDAAVRLEGVLGGHERQISWIDTPGGRLLLPRLEAAVGTSLRLSIMARDVMLAVGARPAGLSARNILEARVEELASRGNGTVIARLRLPGGAALLSSITEDAVSALGLCPGLSVFAIVKSVAVDGPFEGGE